MLEGLIKSRAQAVCEGTFAVFITAAWLGYPRISSHAVKVQHTG